ncbi:MAG TPA: ABC transporter substrate-binding protein [Methylomirabilota bacterium]|jgi:NitT/TauT family transport system substrate-binding protein|nr:ABC transporter substrate-binding protein [Methylomirabilota bacterium]
MKNVCAAALVLIAALLGSGVASAQALKIKVGRTTGASGFHIPTYVAMDRGLFKAEGLDAEFVSMTGGEIVRATIAKEIDFAPIPGGSTEAMLKGAPLVFVVGESLVSQWTLTTTADIRKVEDLRGKTLGLGRPGSADYSELVVVLSKFFKMEAGKDYKVINFRGEPERIAAIIAGSIQGAGLSFPHAARAEAEGLKILVRAGDHLPRLGGTISTHRDNVRDRRDVMKRFIRAVARAADYIRTERVGTVEIIQKYFQIQDARVAENLYNQLQDKFAPQIPKDLFRQLFDSVATPELGWPKDKPLPDVEQFVARDLLQEVLREMGKPLN